MELFNIILPNFRGLDIKFQFLRGIETKAVLLKAAIKALFQKTNPEYAPI